MKISFTGIHNTIINAYSRNVELIDANTENNNKTKFPATEFLINLDCDLSDDKFEKNEENQDLKQFYDAMYKSQYYCVDSNNPYHVNIKAHSFLVDDNENMKAVLDFKINDIPIDLDKPVHRKLLPLYTFMAHLVSKIQQRNDITDAEKINAQVINDYVHSKAMHFIDNIME